MASFMKKVTGKSAIEELEAQNADLKSDLEEALKELEATKAALAQANLDLARERQVNADLQDNLKALRTDETEDQTAVFKQQAEAVLATASEEVKAKALADASILYEAMSGLMTNDKKIANAIGPNSCAQLQILNQVYVTSYGKSLPSRITKCTSGNFRTYLLGLLDTVPIYQCKLIEDACGTLSTDTDVILEVLCPMESAEIMHLKNTYQTLFQKDLLEVCNAAVPKDVGDFLTVLLTSTADQTGGTNATLIESDCAALYAAGQGKTIGCDKVPFIQILGNRSNAHIAALNDAYKSHNKKGLDLVAAIKKVFGGHLRKAFTIVVLAAISKPAYFAFRCEEAMQGLGCDDLQLMRVLITRRDFDIEAIKTAYAAAYNQDLGARIKDELSGNLRRVALLSIGCNPE